MDIRLRFQRDDMTQFAYLNYLLNVNTLLIMEKYIQVRFECVMPYKSILIPQTLLSWSVHLIKCIITFIYFSIIIIIIFFTKGSRFGPLAVQLAPAGIFHNFTLWKRNTFKFYFIHVMAAIILVFSITWSFRNNLNMLIWWLSYNFLLSMLIIKAIVLLNYFFCANNYLFFSTLMNRKFRRIAFIWNFSSVTFDHFIIFFLKKKLFLSKISWLVV